MKLYRTCENIDWIHDFPKATLKLPQNDRGKLEMYDAINRRAAFFEDNQKVFLDLKRNIVARVKDKPKNMLTDDELEAFLIEHL